MTRFDRSLDDGSEPGTSGSRAVHRPRKLGVLGTLVWDTILDEGGDRDPVQEWGGISYAMETLSIALPEGWVMAPILRMGEDLAKEALAYVRSIPRIGGRKGIQVVPFPHHRVELRYLDPSNRTELLTGGLPPWSWEELEPLLDEVDALYVNFITGLEMEVDTALALRRRFPIPLYADLHSLFLGLSSDGRRFPRVPPGGEAWFSAFDAVQMNEQEFQLMAGAEGDPWEAAVQNVRSKLRLVTVTLGAEGAGFVAAPQFDSDPLSWPAARGASESVGAALMGRSRLPDSSLSGDPTGCGDVWGATFFSRLLGGDTLEDAMAGANRYASRKVEYRGARGLRFHLRQGGPEG